MKQIHRRYYTSRLCAYEYLVKTRVSEKAKTEFLKNYQTDIKRLDVFREIYEQVSDPAEGREAGPSHTLIDSKSEEALPSLARASSDSGRIGCCGCRTQTHQQRG